MKIGIVSGKGGAGKTFIATNLLRSMEGAYYLDCDVEEPNGSIFLRSGTRIREGVYSQVPEFNMDKCQSCKTCLESCRFKALAHIGGEIILSAETCHACGACGLFCPSGAVTFKDRLIGYLEMASQGSNKIFTGILNPGEAKGLDIIASLFKKVDGLDANIIVDCPPGTACNLIESVARVDYCLVVVEPTIFGLDNLKMVVELLRVLKKPFSLLINKAMEEELRSLGDYIKKEGLDLLDIFYFDPSLASLLARGELAVDKDLVMRKKFQKLALELERRLKDEATIGS